MATQPEMAEGTEATEAAVGQEGEPVIDATEVPAEGESTPVEAEGTAETVAVDSGDQVIETTEAAESIPSDEMPVEGEAVEPAAGE